MTGSDLLLAGYARKDELREHCSGKPQGDETQKHGQRRLLGACAGLFAGAGLLDFCGRHWANLRACAIEAGLAAGSFVATERIVSFLTTDRPAADEFFTFFGIPFLAFPLYACLGTKLRPIDPARFERHGAKAAGAGPVRVFKTAFKCLGVEIALNQALGLAGSVLEDGGQELASDLRGLLSESRLRFSRPPRDRPFHIRARLASVAASVAPPRSRRRPGVHAHLPAAIRPPPRRHGRHHDPLPPGIRDVWGRLPRRLPGLPAWLPEGRRVVEDAVMPAVCEEFYFRYLLFRRLEAQAGKIPAQAISATLFAWAHEYTSTRILLEVESLRAVAAVLCSVFGGPESSAHCRSLDDKMDEFRAVAREEGLSPTWREIGMNAAGYIPFGWWSAESYVETGCSLAAPIAMHFGNNYLALTLEKLFGDEE
eukprot:tig00001292_g8043.t1